MSLMWFITSFFIPFCVIFNKTTSGNPVQPTALYNKSIDDIPVLDIHVPFGESVTLPCRSNDKEHNFIFWMIGDTVVGPSNGDENRSQFAYHTLSGNLTVKAASLEKPNVYHCFSRGVRSSLINVRSVRLIVEPPWDELYNNSSELNLFRSLIAITSIVILAGIGYAVYRIWRNRFRNPSYLDGLDDDEDDSGDELFSAPSTSRSTDPIVRNSSELFDNPGISTDFKSILETANSKP